MEIVEECGFVQNGNARLLKRTGTDLAAIIVRGRHSMFLGGVAEQMLACAKGMKTPFIVEYIDEADDEFDVMRKLHAEQHAGGFILLGSRLDERSEAVRMLGVPCVFATVDASGRDLGTASSVCIDDRAATRSMMDRLLDGGHRRVAIFGGNPEGDDPFARRYQGALDSLEAHGVAFDPALSYQQARFSLQGAYDCAKAFFTAHPDVTAVLTMSDTMAVGVIRALRDMGLRVPQDVSVTGYDGTQMARYYIPSIATVCQPVEAIAKESVAQLVRMMEGGMPSHVTVDYTLVEGESIAPRRE
jgi:LacI family transcriptional regulator